jgi:exopolysaccharide biosynthesis polyprenyl glycosylphosphotransferase
MKQNFSFIYKFILLLGDLFSLVGAFSLAYILRVSLDPRPIAVPVEAVTYITLIIILLPIWLGVFALLGLYRKRNYERRPQEATRLLVGAVFGIMLMVTFDFFSPDTIFPAKLVPVYAAFFGFIILLALRTILRGLRLYSYGKNYGIVHLLLVGNSETTYYLAKYLWDNPQSGYKIVGIVANKPHVFEKYEHKQFRSLADAIETTNPHAIIQTDSEDVVKVYNLAIEHHLDYQFIPSHEALFTAKHSVELLGGFPIINVHTTPLIGYGRAVKRGMDILFSLGALIITLPLTFLVTILQKLTDLRGPIFYKQERLSRFNKPIYIYKFRSLSRKYNGLTPEQAFEKMGRPELIEKYRKNADHLDNDPRVTPLGHFLRKTKLDEFPQFINVLKGDISLVGPRALVPYELENYEYKALILSVKSGLTGLAQISGRKDISFEERRKLDMYYVQNWSIWMDLQIIIRTIFTVISGRGTR